MKQKYTLHTHTIGFDGQDSIINMIETVKQFGLHTIGISNHFIVHPNIKKSKMYEFAVRGGYSNIYAENFQTASNRFIPHYAEIDALREQYPDIRILRGMEVDFFDNPIWHNKFEQTLKILQPDYIIGSAHFIEYGNTILNSHDWAKADTSTKDILLKKYWTNIANAAQSGLFNWMAHLDLPKKVGLGREEFWVEYENKAIEEANKSKTAIEINTSFYKPNCYEPYPSNRILQMVQRANVPVLISDDAHRAKDLCRHFDEAENIIMNMNLRPYQTR
jgi:histidinol-phosphatase (PHP family)